MNLNAIAGPMVDVVNPPVVGSVWVSDGYTTSPAGLRTAQYVETDGVTMRVQALDGPELALVDGMNIQGVKRAVYLEGNIEGIDRASGKGGDLLKFNGATWLIVTVLETWDTSGWCKVAVAKQTDAA